MGLLHQGIHIVTIIWENELIFNDKHTEALSRVVEGSIPGPGILHY